MKRGEIIKVKISGYAFGGKGIARVETENGEFVVFVENTFPGQLVEARVTKKRKKHAECKLLKVLERSEDEVETEWQPVSGAPYITLPIELQRTYKQDAVFQIYKRIGGIAEPESLFDEFIASPEDFCYRNKMEYSFSSIRQVLETGEEEDDAFALGFKTRGTWWKVENLDRPNGLFDKEFESSLKDIREFLKTTGLPAWHPPQKKGFFRHLVVRKSFAKDKFLINLVTSSQGADQFDAHEFGAFVVGIHGDRIAGIQHTINDDVADRSKIENGTVRLLHGQQVVVEELLGLEFEISMESFFQTNPASAERLYTKAMDYACENFDLSDKVLMDLFCGTGTIGQLFASKFGGARVVGVDIVEEAIIDARRNAERNGVSNVEFHAADVGKFLREYPEYQGKIHTVILDPPRAGIAPKSLQKVIALGAQQIVYISCNPATQARDMKDLEESGYKLQKFSLVDQFPHTSHIESVALFMADTQSKGE